MINFLRRVFSGSTGLYKYEHNIIGEVQSRLGLDAGDRLQKQVEKINKIQRLVERKEVNFYQMCHGRPAFDDSLRFPDQSDEAILAGMSLVHPEKRTKLKVEVRLAKGRLFSFLFNKSPARFFAGLDLKNLQPEIVDVTIWRDPMQFHIPSVSVSIDEVNLTGWLQELSSEGCVTDLHRSLPDAEREVMLRSIDARLPTEYIDLCAQTEGVKLGTCTVYGMSGIRKVVLPDHNYYLLAEIERKAALAVEEGSQEAKIYFLDFENEEVNPSGLSFKEAVMKVAGLPSTGCDQNEK
jgi:hypothetical protein